MSNSCSSCQGNKPNGSKAKASTPNASSSNADGSNTGIKSGTFWIKVLAVVFLVNLVVMVIFTATVNRKLTEAIELAKPQEGLLTMITAGECTFCSDFSSQMNAITAQNVDIIEEQELDSKSSEGKALIEKYNIEKLPAVVFETRERIKTSLKSALEKDGRSVSDTVMVWEQKAPPYFDLTTQETAGLVEATFLIDRKCEKCYDVQQVHKSILSRFGIILASEEIIDIQDPEGKLLRSAYDITKVPTIILSPQIADYTGFQSMWKQIGSVEEDGTYIFRELDVLKVTYKDLESGKILGIEEK